MAGDFSDDFSDDFDNEDSEYQVRVSPVVGGGETVREGFKYEWTAEEVLQTAYSKPTGVADEDLTVTELDATEAAALAARLAARHTRVHHVDYAGEVV